MSSAVNKFSQKLRDGAQQRAAANQEGRVVDDEQQIDEPVQQKQQPTLMPTGDEMFRLLKALDLTYKTEMIFYQLHGIIFWCSVIDVLLWVVLLFAFFAVPKFLWIVWLLAGHPVRGVLGMVLLKFLPSTHEIVEDIDLSDIPQEQMSVEKLTTKIKFDLSVQFMNKAQESKNYQLFYSVATGLIYIFDVLSFCIAFYQFSGVAGNEHADVIMLVFTLIFLGIDAYYFLWVLSLKSKLPPDMACYVSDAILGYSKKMSRELWHNLDTASRSKVAEAKNKFRQKKDQQRIQQNEEREEAKKNNKQNQAATKKATADKGKPSAGGAKPGAGAAARK